MQREFFTLSYDDRNIKVLEISKNQKVFFGETKLPSGLVSSGKIVRKDNFAENLKVLLSQTKPQKIAHKDAVVAIPESKVFLKIVEIPKIPLNRIEQALDWQAESLLPLAKENLYLDWQTIAETPEGKLKLLITACPKDIIDPLIESLFSIGITILSIKSKAGALAGLFATTPHKSILIINREAEETSFIIAKNQIARVSTSISTQEEPKPFLNKIQETIEFYERKKSEKKVEEIVLISEGKTAEIEKSLASKLSLPVKIGHYPKRMAKLPAQEETAYIINLGLAFDPFTGVNLLPEPLKNNLSIEEDNKKFQQIQQLLILVAILSLFIFSVFWWVLLFKSHQTSKILESFQLTQVPPKVQEIEKTVQDLNQRIPRIESLEDQKSHYAAVLEKISSISQNGVKVLTFSYNSQTSQYKITGLSSTRDQLLNFREQLQRQNDFSNVTIPLKSLERPTDVGFEIYFEVNTR